MNDLKKDIQANGLKMDLGLFDNDTMDPNGCHEGCLAGCINGCWLSGLPRKQALAAVE